jgi:hypothetical protein
MMIDSILEKFNLKFEDLTSVERETFLTWLDALQKNQLSLEKVREYIHTARSAVEEQLVNEPEFIRIFLFKVENRKQIFLKARLRNYMLIEAFLSSPDKAKEAIERALASIKPGKGVT